MSILNKLDCVAGGANTGYGDCFIDPKFIAGGILVPPDKVYTAEQLADKDTFLAALQADILADVAERIYPLAKFAGVTDNTETPTLQTLGYGGLAVTREGLYNLSFQFIQGGLCLSKSLRKFNSSNKTIIVWDADGVMYGWKSGTGFRGIPLELFYQNPFRVADGTNVTNYTLQVAFKPYYLNDEPGFVKIGLGDLEALKGLQDIVLSETTGSNLPILKLKANTGCNSYDLFDLYEDELAEEALWVASNQSDGSEVAVTSVAKDTALKAWTVTLDAADIDVSGTVIVTLVSPEELNTAGISGYEALKLSVQ